MRSLLRSASVLANDFGSFEIEADKILAIQFDRQLVAGPFGKAIGAVAFVEVRLEMLADLAFEHFEDQIFAVGPFENLLAIAVDVLALLVHHLVVFEQILANLEVALFDLLLGAFDAARDHAAFDRFAFLHAQRS